MKIKTLNQKTNYLKIALATTILMVVAILGFSICNLQQANASDNNQESNGSLIVSKNDEYLVFESEYGDTGWVPVSEAVVPSSSEWTNYSIDILQEYASDHTLNEVVVHQEGSSTHRLYITLYDNNDQKRIILFIFSSDVPMMKWLLNNKPVPSEDNRIDLSIENNITYGEFEGFNLIGRVTTTENTATPIEGAFVQYVDLNTEDPIQGDCAYTAADGTFSINDISVENLPGSITIEKEGYILYYHQSPISQEDIVEGVVDLGDIQLSQDVEVDFTITGLEHHDHFRELLIFMGEVMIDEDYVSMNKLSFPLESTYSINEAGVLSVRYPEGEIETDDYSYTIEPFGEEGFVVDKWNINGSDLEVGKIYTVASLEELNFLVSYKVPEPEPAPVPENTEASSAQTGDMTSTVVFTLTIIALLSAGVVLRKKINLK